MKKILFAAIFTATIFTTAKAQNTAATAEAATIAKTEKEASKAEKLAAKEKKEAELVEAFKKAGLTAEEQKKCRAILDASNEKTKPVKADESLDDDAKKEKLDAIYKDRNDNLKATMGEAKYKIFKATQKAQKEAAGN